MCRQGVGDLYEIILEMLLSLAQSTIIERLLYTTTRNHPPPVTCSSASGADGSKISQMHVTGIK